jgi:hypothetical protein
MSPWSAQGQGRGEGRGGEGGWEVGEGEGRGDVCTCVPVKCTGECLFFTGECSFFARVKRVCVHDLGRSGKGEGEPLESESIKRGRGVRGCSGWS